MKNNLICAALFIVMLTGCSKENIQADGLNGSWTLFSYSNIVGQYHCEYESKDIVWEFENDKLDIEGRLVDPRAFVPCYEVSKEFLNNGLSFEIEKVDSFEYLRIPDMNLEAKILKSDNELILEVITSTDFKPAFDGVKVLFNRI